MCANFVLFHYGKIDVKRIYPRRDTKVCINTARLCFSQNRALQRLEMSTSDLRWQRCQLRLSVFFCPNTCFVQILRLGEQAGFSNCFVFFAKKKMGSHKMFESKASSLNFSFGRLFTVFFLKDKAVDVLLVVLNNCLFYHRNLKKNELQNLTEDIFASLESLQLL